MKHIGKLLKKHIEDNHLVKGEIAKQVGITYNYLSTIFDKKDVKAELLERLFVAVGLHPGIVFDVPAECFKNFSDISANDTITTAPGMISADQMLKDILAEKNKQLEEKERTIQILLATQKLDIK